MRQLLLLSVLIFLVLLGPQSFSQETSQAEIDSTTAGTTKIPFSGSLSMTAITDNHSFDSDEKTNLSIIGLTLSTKIKNFSLALSNSLSKDLYSSYEEKINDASLTLGTPSVSLDEKTKLSSKLSSVIPLSKASQKITELYTILALGITLSRDFEMGTSANLSLGHKRYFNRYTTDLHNSPLIKEKYSAALSVGHSFNDFFTISGSFSYTQAKSYKDILHDDQYVTGLDLSYAFNTRNSLSLGMETGGEIYNVQRGRDQLIQFFDQDITTFYANYGVSF